MHLSYRQMCRFLDKFDCPGQGCWEWKGGKSKYGYGKVYLNNLHWRAHRASYALFYGDFDQSLTVRHTCDNPSCVRPEHLELGTHQDNMDDCVERSRRPKGENHYARLFSADEIKKIRELLATGNYSQMDVALMYGVSRSTICHIKLQNTWRLENAQA